jgi:hypothetical protein
MLSAPAKIIQDGLGIESDDVVNYCLAKDWPADREAARQVHRRVAEDRGAVSGLVTEVACRWSVRGH